MVIMKEEIDKFILAYQGELNHQEIYKQFVLKYKINNNAERYVVNTLIQDCIENTIQYETVLNERRNKLNKLKQLELPEQRSPEWYELRKEILTASSLAAAIGHCHFKTRDELIYDKIVYSCKGLVL